MNIFQKTLLFPVLIILLSGCSGSKMETQPPESPFPHDIDEVLVDGRGGDPSEDLFARDSAVGSRRTSTGTGGPAPATDRTQPPPASASDTSPCEAGQLGTREPPPTAPGESSVRRTDLEEIIPETIEVPDTECPLAGRPDPSHQGHVADRSSGGATPQSQVAPVDAPHLVKVLFVVDKTWYNQQMDTDASLRISIVRSIYEAHQNEGWYSWGLITFEGDEARGDPVKAHITNRRGNDPIFTSNRQIVESAIREIQIDVDEGWMVFYKKALDMVKKTIRDDLERPTQGGSHYAVIFIAGTSPRDEEYGGLPHHNYNSEKLASLDNDIRDIVNLGQRGYNNRVTFSTVYYGIEHRAGHYLEYDGGGTRNPNPKRIDPRLILERMARNGGRRI